MLKLFKKIITMQNTSDQLCPQKLSYVYKSITFKITKKINYVWIFQQKVQNFNPKLIETFSGKKFKEATQKETP